MTHLYTHYGSSLEIGSEFCGTKVKSGEGHHVGEIRCGGPFH